MYETETFPIGPDVVIGEQRVPAPLEEESPPVRFGADVVIGEQSMPAPVEEELWTQSTENDWQAQPEPVAAEELLAESVPEADPLTAEDAQLKALLEAVVYVTDEPLTLSQISAATQQPRERIQRLLDELVSEFDRSHHGLMIREVAGGYKMATKPEHHEGVRNFVKNLKPSVKLSLAALETLAVIAYKQPITAPEIMEIRGVQGAGVLKTLLDRKLIATAGRKNVIGKPILYKTTKDFLIQFGLKELSELPSLKEFEEIRRMAIADDDSSAAAGSEVSSQGSGKVSAMPRETGNGPVEAPPVVEG